MFSYTLASSLLLGVAFGACNYAVLNNMPMVTDKCYSCDGDDCGGLIGIMTTCNSAGTAANVTYYADAACSTVGAVVAASAFNCGASGSCSSVEATATVYGSTDCSGNSTGVIAVDLEPAACFFSSDFGAYLGVKSDESAIVVGAYSNSSCSVGTVYYTYSDGDCVPDIIGDGFILALSVETDDSSSLSLNVGVFTFVSAICGIIAVLYH